MIHTLHDLPDSVVGFSAIGDIRKEDYEKVIIPAVEDRLRTRDRLSLLYVIGPKFRHFHIGAMWDDLLIGLKHIRHWEKIAVVTEVRWIRGCLHCFQPFMPGRLRLFIHEEIGKARKWVAAA